MSLFDVDFNQVVKQLVPKQVRNTKMLAWIGVLVSPVNYAYGLFMTQRYDNLYVLAHTGQVCYLRAVLNDAFDTALRRITIDDGPDYEPIYIYEAAELKPVALYTVAEAHPDYLYTGDEIVTLGVDFVVEVPTIVTTIPGWNIGYMYALLDKFKQASKTYKVVMS